MSSTRVTFSDSGSSDESKAWEDKYIGSWQTTRPADRYVYLIDESRLRRRAMVSALPTGRAGLGARYWSAWQYRHADR